MFLPGLSLEVKSEPDLLVSGPKKYLTLMTRCFFTEKDATKPSYKKRQQHE